MKRSDFLIKTLTLITSITIFCACHANAAGGTVHILMSEKALEQVANPELKQLLEDNKKIVLWASWYPDSGYVPGNQYGEYSHWTEFQDGYFDYIQNEIGPEHKDYRKLVAHFMGAFAHGMEDQVFDKVFLAKTREIEGHGQELLDRGLDMVCMSDHQRFKIKFMDAVSRNPGKYTPISHLVKVYEKLGKDYDNIGGQIARGQKFLSRAIQGEKLIFRMEESDVRQKSPWAAENYFEAPGGVMHNAKVIAALWEDLWRRFNGEREKFLISTLPEDGGEILSSDHLKVDSNISLYFSSRYSRETINPRTFIVTDGDGGRMPGSFEWGYGHNMMRFIPERDYDPGKKYTVTISQEVRGEKGVSMPGGYTFTFTAPERNPKRETGE